MKVAIVGIGNCACSLVQAIEAAKKGILPQTGLAYPKFGSYAVADIEIVAAFDIDARKIGKDVASAIISPPNCTTSYFPVEPLGVLVSPGPLCDGVAPHMEGMFCISKESQSVTEESVVKVLKESNAEIVVSYLPVGSQLAAETYARAAVGAGCAFVNCMPASIANNETFVQLFMKAKLPILGDDVKSQVGSTAIHRALIDILEKKGVQITHTYQLNIGGNTDFMNMRNPERASSKKRTKENSLRHLFSNEPELGVGPSDYVPQLKDHKVGYINIEGVGLLGMPFSIEMKLKVEDSPNSAGVVLNAIRAAQVALDRGLSGPVHEVCPWLFKNPPIQMSEAEVFAAMAAFAGEENC